jgi:hypothetical protein
MSESISPKSYGNRLAWIFATIALVVAVAAIWKAVVKLSEDDCTSVTTTLPNGTAQTVRTCS